MTNKSNGAAFFAGLVCGGLIGASLALLFAPQSGEQTRTQIRDKSLALKNQTTESISETSHRAQEQVAIWQEKGKEALELGRRSAVEGIRRGTDSIMEVMSHGKDTVVQTLGHSENKVAEVA